MTDFDVLVSAFRTACKSVDKHCWDSIRKGRFRGTKPLISYVPRARKSKSPSLSDGSPSLFCCNLQQRHCSVNPHVQEALSSLLGLSWLSLPPLETSLSPFPFDVSSRFPVVRSSCVLGQIAPGH
jgi:hypothetical protein